jgi:prophage regulatory protein
MKRDTKATHPKLLRVADICALLGVSRNTLLAWRRHGDFPKARQLGPRTLAWAAQDITAWLAKRPRSATLPPSATP